MIISKEADKNIVLESDIITYKITLENDNSSTVFNVIVTDNIPKYTSFILGSVEVNEVPKAGADIEAGITIDIMQSGGKATVTFKVRVDIGCNKCSIENVANVRYLLNGTNYSEFSNILVIPKDCCQKQNPCNTFANKYVVPGPGTQSATEIVIMTDEDCNGGVMTLPGNTLALSSEAVKLLKKAFVEQYPAKVSDLNPTNNYQISALLVSLNNAGIISLVENPPAEEARIEYNVSPGDTINIPSTDCQCEAILEPIDAQYSGRVICIGIGSWIRLYIYISAQLIPNINCTTTTSNGYEAISTFGPLGYTIYPEPIYGAIGSNCGACGTCGLCTGCAWCGTSPIIAAAAAALVSSVSVVSLSVVANTNTPQ